MSLASAPRQQAPARPMPPPAAAKPSQQALTSLLNTIAAIQGVVEEETAALNSRKQVDFDTFTQRKSQGLLELNRAMKGLGTTADHPTVVERLARLREKLAINQATLQLHLDAVREISTLMANAIREAESDGTYSQSIRSPGMSYGYD